MKLSLNWIRDYVEIDEHRIADLPLMLTMATAEVEGVEQKGQDLDGVVAGVITAIAPHPESDQLNVITVDTGDVKEQSVCGAPNLYCGMKIPFAKAGGKLPGIGRVARREVHGISSDGMACSLRDLGVGDSHEEVLELTDDAAPGTDVKELLGLEDTLIDIDNKSLTHRPDLWGHYGFAREIAALTGKELKPLPLASLEELRSVDPVVTARIHDNALCSRYTVIGIDGVRIMPSPGRIQTRLSYIGMRPINCIVDLTNYIMLETGQPLHAFDASRTDDRIDIMTMAQYLKSTGRPGRENHFQTLDGVSRRISAASLLICGNGQILALAGIMGGADSEVTERTARIILESATFDPASVRKSAAALGLRTEAVMRFEKSLDPSLALDASRRFLYLLKAINPGVRIDSGLYDVQPRPSRPRAIAISKEYIQGYIGQAIPDAEIERILKSLGFDLKRLFGAGPRETAWEVTVPSYRATKDIIGRVDLVEEISRIYGYDNIRPRPLQAAMVVPLINPEALLEHGVKEILAHQFGMHEIHTYAWYDKDWIRAIGHSDPDNLKLSNPNVSRFDTLRRQLIPNLLAAVIENEGFYDEFSLFEVASVYHPANRHLINVVSGPEADALRTEERRLGVVMYWKGLAPATEADMLDRLKRTADEIARSITNTGAEFGKLEECDLSYVHPVKRCSVRIDGHHCGYLSIINPVTLKQFKQNVNLAFMEISLCGLSDLPKQAIRYQEPSKYPEVNLDFSVLMPKSLPYRSFREDLDGFRHPCLKSVSYGGSYEGPGVPAAQKSITIAFTIAAADHTLSGEEINQFNAAFADWLRENGYGLR